MRSDDEIPACAQYTGEAPECVGTCLSKTRSEIKHQTPEEICEDLRTYCESQALSDYCALHGVLGTSFCWSPHLVPRRRRPKWLPSRRPSKLHCQFWTAYQENPDLNIALAFHGTGDANVAKILHNGLDPQFRRTQAFGKGEYFSKEPGLAATYRHEGHCLLVFALLMPKDHEKVYSQKDRDIIVVPELAHQLPLGVVRFTSVDELAIRHSQEMRLANRALKEAARDADWKATEVRWKAKLEPLLQNGLYQEARETLREATRYHDLSDSMQQEIASMIQKHVSHADTVAWFPKFADAEQSDTVSSSKSLSALEEEAQLAWKAFWAMKMDPKRNSRKDSAPCPDFGVLAATFSQQIQAPGAKITLEQ